MKVINPSVLIAKNVSYLPRLFSFSFEAKKKEIIHILGSNGSGKTTLLNQLSGIEKTTGELIIDGCLAHNLSREALSEKRALLSQQQTTGFNITVYQYLYLSLPAHCKSQLNSNTITKKEKTEIEKIINYLCERLSISDKLERTVNQLSGGEWQRVRIAGVCLQISPSLQPKACFLLLDEPAAGLDVAQQIKMHLLLKELAQDGLSIIMTNHDINSAISNADTIIMLKKGKLIAMGCSKKVITEDNLLKAFDTPFRLVDVDGVQIAVHKK